MAAVSCNNKENHFDYAIVGGGCFGASTVLALKRAWPDARIIWFEGTHTYTASRDTSKIVRAAYEDDDYVAFAGKSLEMWATLDPYREFYHQTGWVQVVGEGSQANTIKGPNDRMISIEEMQERVGSREEPNLAAGEELRLNEDIGYVDCDLAMEAVAKEASTLGVIRVKKDVTKLMVEGGVCLGVEAGDDRVTADTTIVAAGPWTPGLLDRSQVLFPQDFFTVAGVGVATMPLTEEEFDELKTMPILVTMGGLSNSIDLILFQLTYNRRSHTIRKA
jgi:glycine/D-amino acid oxidase-like deaminating enzyme